MNQAYILYCFFEVKAKAHKCLVSKFQRILKDLQLIDLWA